MNITTVFKATIYEVETTVIEETIKHICAIPFIQDACDKEIVIIKEDNQTSIYRIEISLVFKYNQLDKMYQNIQKLEMETPNDLIDNYNVTSNITL
jgi:hypothetical protein